jgi:hypothetical protein
MLPTKESLASTKLENMDCSDSKLERKRSRLSTDHGRITDFKRHISALSSDGMLQESTPTPSQEELDCQMDGVETENYDTCFGMVLIYIRYSFVLSLHLARYIALSQASTLVF